MWTPDVYEGSPTPVTAFFATAPKVAAAAMFARLLLDAFGGAVASWQQILSLLAVASMFLGAVAAIGQRNIKRLMAYSSIGHMGYALMGLAAGTEEGAQSLLIYLAIYVTMNVGVFAFILNMERDGKPVTDIYALGLYSRVEPARALALAVLLFSLAGVPPLVGFFGKFYVLKAAVDAGLVWLAVAGVVASVIGAYYYLRIVYLMYFGEAVGAARRADADAALGAAGGLGAGDGGRRRQPLRGRGDRRLGRRDARAVADGAPGRPGSAARSCDELDSTNAEALRRAAAGEAGPVWILARRQTAARGRRGRAWAIAPGNFAATLLDAAAGGAGAALVRGGARALRRDGRGHRAAGALRAEVAERRAAGRAASSPASCSSPGPPGTLAVGIGVNLAAAPDPAALEPGAVTPVEPARRDRHRDRARGLPRPAGAGGAGLGGAACAPRASRRSAPPGSPAPRGSARRSPRGCRGGRMTGRFETVDETGALVLATAAGRVVLPAAEVISRRSAHAARH